MWNFSHAPGWASRLSVAGAQLSLKWIQIPLRDFQMGGEGGACAPRAADQNSPGLVRKQEGDGEDSKTRI